VTYIRVENLTTHAAAFALCLALFVAFTALSHNMNRSWCDAHVRVLNGAIFFAVIVDVCFLQPLSVAGIALYRYLTSEEDPEEEGDAVICHEAYPVPFEWRYVGLPPPLPGRHGMY